MRTARHRPPGPHARYPGEFVVELVRDMRLLFGRMAQLGDVTEISVAGRRLVVLNHPNDVQRVLVTEQRNFTKGRALERTKALLGEGLLTNEGESHLRQRRLAQPSFHRDRIAGYGAVMADYAERAQRTWRDGETLDIHQAMMGLTLAIVTKTLFDEDVEANTSVVAEAIELSLRMFNYTVVPLGMLLEQLPIPWVRRLHRARQRMDDLIATMIADRRRDGADRGDLLSLLISAQDDGHGMSDRQLRDELVTILMAGHETTAVALSWTWYLLSQHPDVEQRLHRELDEVLGLATGAPERVPTVADLPRLPYTRSVFAESMRLYPPAWAIERKAVGDFEVGGYTVPAGAFVLMCPYHVHRDPRWWPEAERFNPDRWRADGADHGSNGSERPKFAYFQFGAGTRICIGEQFAWMEGILALATLARRWRMRHDSTHRVAMEPLVTLRPKYGMRMTLERRPGR
ncbi:MAG TPA: cytochrome P450 [Gemmatimonadaceae bacterium]|jgi:cytochrome P450|nr:cytochrome P450 [Gemmatimonadaceae bacterium]